MKFLLVDDHKIIREGLKQILLLQFPSAVFNEASNAEEVIDSITSFDCDIVICDMSMPGKSGLDVLQQVKEYRPDLPVLILSMHPEESYAVRALKAGAAGFINKSDGSDILIAAIQKVLQGRKYIPSSVAEQLANNLKIKKNHFDKLHDCLSNRELHVFRLIAEGKSVSEISDLLSLSLSTVSTHRARILKKLRMRTNADLTKYALQHNVI